MEDMEEVIRIRKSYTHY